MKKTLYLHLGYPKTATTTLQKHFLPNIDEINYLGKFDNDRDLFGFDIEILNKIIFYSFENIDCSTIKSQLEPYFNNQKIVLSEESFTSNSLRKTYIDGKEILPLQKNIANNLRKLFYSDEYDVKILFTIRKQDEMITSQYAQSYVHYYSKDKATDTFKKFVNLYTNENSSEHIYVKTLDYFDVVTIYQKLFGETNVTVLVYEELQENPELFYKKLCDFLEVDSAIYSKIAIQKNENKRSTNEKYKKTRDISFFDKLSQTKVKYFPFLKIKLPNNIKEKLKKMIWTNNDKISKTIYLTEHEKKAILEKYKNNNKKLSNMLNLNLERYGYFND